MTDATMQFHCSTTIFNRFQNPAKIHSPAAIIPMIRAAHSIQPGAKIDTFQLTTKLINLFLI